MKTILAAALLLPALFAVPAIGQQAATSPPAKPGLTLTSTAFDDGAIIPNQYTMNATSAPVSPALQWTNVPDGAVSFTLLIDDPDTSLHKSTAEVMHWLIFNIPGTARSLPEGVPQVAQLPDGSVQLLNTHNTRGYVGPGAGAAGPYHHYTFQIYALDTKLSVGPDASRADVLQAMDGHILGKGVLIGRFHR